MPWTIADVDRFNSGLTDAQKRQWVRVANSVLATCTSEGGSESTCAARAVREANGAVQNNTSMKRVHTYQTTARNYNARQDTHEGRPHLVVPVVMMREGVHSGSHGAVYHTAEELGRYEQSWNGIPVVIYHPQENGMYVSANDRTVLERELVGRVFNTHMDGDRLRAEAWVDVARMQQISPQTLQDLQDGKAMDVSVGVFTDEEEQTGQWNGEQYTAVAHNHRPDHLAILPDQQGACSYADGCGIRVNNELKKGGNVKKQITLNHLEYNGTTDEALQNLSLSDFGETKWEETTPEQREEIASHFLVCTGDSYEDLKFPVVTKDGKLSTNALKQIATSVQTNLEADPLDSLVLNEVKQLLGPQANSCCDDPTPALKNLQRQGVRAQFIANEAGYRTIATRIQRMLDEMDREGATHWLEELYEDTFIYRVETRQGTEFYKREYTMDENEAISLGGNTTQVRKNVEYVPMTQQMNNNANHKNEDNMANKKVDALIANSATQFTENDRAQLEALPEEILDKMAVNNAEPQINGEQLAQALQSYTANDPNKFIGLLPKEMQGQLNHGLRLHREHRENLIKHIQNNTDEGVWTEEQLKGYDDNTLESLAKSIKAPTDYSLFASEQHVPEPQNNAEEVEPLLPPGVVEDKE